MVGRTVTGLEVFGPRTLRRHQPGPADFIARVAGRRVEAACRRGKYLWLPLSTAASPVVAGPQPRSRVAASPVVAGAQPRSDEAASPVVAGPQPRSRVAASPVVAGPQPRSDDSTAVDSCVIAHLGMSGQFLVVEAGTPVEPHLRARFSFTDGGPEIRFLD